jgi:hypothetical protein
VKLPRLLAPVTDVDPRPDPETKPLQAAYVRSYLVMRAGIGLFCLMLPIATVFLDRALFNETPFFRGSISDYYYSGMRDAFVFLLSASGVFFITYKVAERNLDNLASLAAGVCACVIALFPTSRASSADQLTRLQAWLGEKPVSDVHDVASAGLVISLTVLSITFGIREGRRLRREKQRCPPAFWKWLHWACSGAMLFSLLWIVITGRIGSPPNSLLIGEWIACWAFGLSWLAKGAELDMLFHGPNPIPKPPPS